MQPKYGGSNTADDEEEKLAAEVSRVRQSLRWEQPSDGVSPFSHERMRAREDRFLRIGGASPEGDKEPLLEHQAGPSNDSPDSVSGNVSGKRISVCQAGTQTKLTPPPVPSATASEALTTRIMPGPPAPEVAPLNPTSPETVTSNAALLTMATKAARISAGVKARNDHRKGLQTELAERPMVDFNDEHWTWLPVCIRTSHTLSIADKGAYFGIAFFARGSGRQSSASYADIADVGRISKRQAKISVSRLLETAHLTMERGSPNRYMIAALFPFDKISHEIAAAAVSFEALLVYAALVSRSGDKDRCWPAYGRLAQDAGLSRSSAIRAESELEEAGVIEVRQGDRRSNTYILKKRIRADLLQTELFRRMQLSNPNDAVRKPRLCSPETPTVQSSDLNQSLDTNTGSRGSNAESQPQPAAAVQVEDTTQVATPILCPDSISPSCTERHFSRKHNPYSDGGNLAEQLKQYPYAKAMVRLVQEFGVPNAEYCVLEYLKQYPSTTVAVIETFIDELGDSRRKSLRNPAAVLACRLLEGEPSHEDSPGLRDRRQLEELEETDL